MADPVIEMSGVWKIFGGAQQVAPEVIYLEGIYVEPGERGKGYGSAALSQLGRLLLQRTGSICLTVNVRKNKTKGFYNRAGFVLRSYYDTIYLQTAE